MKLFCARGSAPPLRAAARRYQERFGVLVEVATCGQACVRGACGPGSRGHSFVDEVGAGSFDLAVAGSAADMDDLDYLGRLAPGTRRSLGLREAVILVPESRAARIGGLEDLRQPGVRIAISSIDCLRGVWEDVCGRADCIEEVGRNIAVRVGGCMALLQALGQERVDAAFGWSSFVHLSRSLVARRLPTDFRVYRATVGAVLEGAQAPEVAMSFLAFLTSPDANELFTSQGWIRGAKP